MGGQLGNEWVDFSQRVFDNTRVPLCVKLRFLVRCHRVMWSSENPHTSAGARRVQLLRRFKAASHIHFDYMQTRKGSNVFV